ncbi:hypothetical protein [Granulicella sp. S156]|uniref:hypothetical protein n=1 Tax=Granulicella sp. S156 TaxID=1747224 RepID=UPI00131C875A|nr:hypothetical protein [Granulicella sp. S156]
MRNRAFRCGCGLLGLSVGLYLIALVYVPHVAPLQDELRAGARFFVVGGLINLLASVLLMFGKGWKRVPLMIASILGIFFWYGFTLY